MRTRIRTKRAENLTTAEVKACRRLTIEYGSMKPCLELSRENPSLHRGRVFLLEAEDGRLLAWVLVCNPSGGRRREAYFYVRSEARRRGYGSRLARRVERLAPEAKVCPWDSVSRAFFGGVKLQRSPLYGG